MLPAPATIDPSELPMVVLIVALTSPLFRSMRVSVLSPQFGTHNVPNAAASPEHGRAPVAIVERTVFVFGSKRATVPFAAFETHTDASTAIQSGDPAYANTASGFRRSIGILTPAVLTPGRGGRSAGGVPCVGDCCAT